MSSVMSYKAALIWFIISKNDPAVSIMCFLETSPPSSEVGWEIGHNSKAYLEASPKS